MEKVGQHQFQIREDAVTHGDFNGHIVGVKREDRGDNFFTYDIEVQIDGESSKEFAHTDPKTGLQTTGEHMGGRKMYLKRLFAHFRDLEESERWKNDAYVRVCLALLGDKVQEDGIPVLVKLEQDDPELLGLPVRGTIGHDVNKADARSARNGEMPESEVRKYDRIMFLESTDAIPPLTKEQLAEIALGGEENPFDGF